MGTKYAADTTATSSKMFMDEDITNVTKTSLQTRWQESYWHTSKSILPGQNSLGSCLHRTCTIPSGISPSDLNAQLSRASFNGQKMGKLYGDGSRLHAGCQSTSHHTAFSWPWTVRITQDRQCRAAGWFQEFVLDPGTHLSKCLIITMLLNDLKSRSRNPPVSLWSYLFGITTLYACHLYGVLECHTHLTLTRLNVLFYISVCQCVYQVKRAAVPSTLPLQSHEQVPIVTPPTLRMCPPPPNAEHFTHLLT